MTRVWRTALLLTLASTSGCLADQPLTLPVDVAPRAVQDGWTLSAPEAAGFDQARLRQFFQDFHADPSFRLSRSLLIVRHGRLVAEDYTRKKAHAEEWQHIKSASKSVTSLLLGIAIAQGSIASLDQPVSAFLPDAFARAPEKGAITLGQLLTMRSGLDYENSRETTALMVTEPESSLRFIVDRPLAAPPGTQFHYSDGDVHLLGAALQAATGQRLDEFARQHLFTPLGITDFKWEAHGDGHPYAAYGLYMKPRDMAKVGQLCLQNGHWQGRQVVPATWLAESTQARANLNNGPYGYYWWIRPDQQAYSASGHGGQFIYVLPKQDMVVVHTAEPYTRTPLEGITLASFEALLHRLSAALVD